MLEAITELPFPVNESLCTRYPTEVVFCRTRPGDDITVEASIKPGKLSGQDPLLRERIKGFTCQYNDLSSVTMTEIINKVGTSSCRFASRSLIAIGQ